MLQYINIAMYQLLHQFIYLIKKIPQIVCLSVCLSVCAYACVYCMHLYVYMLWLGDSTVVIHYHDGLSTIVIMIVQCIIVAGNLVIARSHILCKH